MYSVTCVLSSLPKSNYTHDLIVLYVYENRSTALVFGKKGKFQTHCLNMSWFQANRLNVIVFINDIATNPLFTDSLWISLFVIFHSMDVIQGAQAEKYKHSRIHTRTHTHRHTFIQNLYVHARFIRVQFLYRATNSFEMEKIHQQRVTNSIWKSLNQIYLACFPFGYTSYTVFSFFFSI